MVFGAGGGWGSVRWLALPVGALLAAWLTLSLPPDNGFPAPAVSPDAAAAPQERTFGVEWTGDLDGPVQACADACVRLLDLGAQRATALDSSAPLSDLNVTLDSPPQGQGLVPTVALEALGAGGTTRTVASAAGPFPLHLAAHPAALHPDEHGMRVVVSGNPPAHGTGWFHATGLHLHGTATAILPTPPG